MYAVGYPWESAKCKTSFTFKFNRKPIKTCLLLQQDVSIFSCFRCFYTFKMGTPTAQTISHLKFIFSNVPRARNNIYDFWGRQQLHVMSAKMWFEFLRLYYTGGIMDSLHQKNWIWTSFFSSSFCCFTKDENILFDLKT